MRLFARKRTQPIRVTLNVRAFVDGHMARASLDARAREGDRLKDLLKQLRHDGAVETSVVRYILRGGPGVTVLKNGQLLPMPEAANTRLANGDELSIITTMAGG